MSSDTPRAYAGIGARATPMGALLRMRQIAGRLAELGYTLRSGGADGADTAFEEACTAAHGLMQLYLPWDGFNDRHAGIVMGNDTRARAIAERFHPAWHRLSKWEQALHARNTGQILGPRCDTRDKSEFVVCWTRGALGGGGTGQALRVARAYDVPIFDLADVETLPNLGHYINSKAGRPSSKHGLPARDF